MICLTLCAFSVQGQTALSFEEDPSFHGDTLHITPAMVEQLQQEEEIETFDREIEKTVFVPKGQWVTGFSVSYSQSNQNKYQFFVLQGISGDTYNFRITPMLCYMVKDDLGLGVKFSYTRALTKLENADVVLDSETSYTADHVYSLSHNYYGTFFMRNYFALGNSKRFGFFNEVQLQLGGGQSKITRGVGPDLTGAYERNFSFDIGIMPGMSVFLSNYSALEVNVGVLGFSYTDTKTITDRIYVAHRKSQSANFRINLFSITFGVTFYI